MGHSQRIVEDNARRRQAREWDQLMRTSQPDTLTPGELRLSDLPLTKSPRRHPVGAWVRYGRRPVWVKGFTDEWTQDATHLRWTVPQGGWHEAWVWSSAVKTRTMGTEEENMLRLGRSVNAAPEF